MRSIVLAFAAALGVSALAEKDYCGHLITSKKALKYGFKPKIEATLESLSDSDVTHVQLDLSMNPPSTTISGSGQLHVTSKALSLTEFTFRLSDSFTMGQVTLDGRPITVTRLNSTTCRANFDQSYTIGQSFVLNIPYAGPAVSAFFGSIEFGTRAVTGPYAFTLSEPWYSYTWWPNKDDNTDKSTFDINVTVPNTLTVVSNGTLQGIDNVGGGLHRVRWSTDYQMVPYLASLGVSAYNTWTTPYDFSGQSMPIQYWIWSDQDNGTNRANWNKAQPMMTVFNNLFGVYPFKDEKYGMYNFTFGGGMEHQTATGMGTFSERTVAHELGHHWWGDMVTCATWHDIWLNEGFASYSEALWDEFKSGGGFAAYQSRMAANRPTVTTSSVYCYDISDPSRIFSSTYSYRKGAWALHQLRKVMGDQDFFETLDLYRSNHEYGTATTDDFISACETVYGKDLNWFFDKIVYGTGAPVFQWNWQTTTANGKNYLLVYVRQTQSATHGTFALPIDIRPTVGGVKQFKQVFSDALTENFVIPLTGAATACTFDEDIWTLNGGVTTTTYVSGGPVVVEATPAPNAKVAVANDVRVTFQTTVTTNASQYSLVKTPSLTPLTRSQKIPISFAYNAATKTVTLTPSSPLGRGHYTLSISDQVRSTVGGALQLDGEFSGTLPTGNGAPGGATKFSFSVSQ